MPNERKPHSNWASIWSNKNSLSSRFIPKLIYTTYMVDAIISLLEVATDDSEYWVEELLPNEIFYTYYALPLIAALIAVMMDWFTINNSPRQIDKINNQLLDEKLKHINNLISNEDLDSLQNNPNIQQKITAIKEKLQDYQFDLVEKNRAELFGNTVGGIAYLTMHCLLNVTTSVIFNVTPKDIWWRNTLENFTYGASVIADAAMYVVSQIGAMQYYDQETGPITKMVQQVASILGIRREAASDEASVKMQ